MGVLNSKDIEVLRQAKPVVFTVLINKIGSIGLSLVPVLLVERQTTNSQSSLVMSSMRLTLIIGTLTSGLFVDKVGARFTILMALLFSAAGLGFIPFAQTALLIGVFGVVAQYGDGLMRIAFRVLLTDSVPYHNHKEALGWLRTANNCGQILSFSVGTLAGGWGTVYLFIFDALTSLGAYFYGLKILPKQATANLNSAKEKPKSGALREEHFSAFILCALIFAGYTFFYEIYMSATAGRLELLYPGRGLRYFSIAMVVNTIVCTLLSVPASRFFQRPSVVFPVGLLFTLLASVCSLGFTDSLLMVYVGSLMISGAEVAMMSLTQFTLMRLTPQSKNSTTWYSAGLTLTHSGRILGAAIVFPWFIQNRVDITHFWSLGLVWVLLASFAFSVRRSLDRATSCPL